MKMTTITLFRRIILIGSLLLVGGFLPQPITAAPFSAPKTSTAFFIENSGQFDPSANFLLENGLARLWITRQGLWLSWLDASLDTTPEHETQTSANLRISFIGANPNPTLLAKNRLDARVNYLTGDRAVSALTWQKVIYKDIYPGIDLVLSAAPDDASQTPFSWRLQTRPGADIAQVRLQIEGAVGITADSTKLSLDTGHGMAQIPLVKLPGQVNSDFAINPQMLEVKDGLFQVSMPLAVDPQSESAIQQTDSGGIEYSTYLGGSAWEVGQDIAVAPDGSVYIVGTTASTDFPTTTGVFDRRVAQVDAFISKFDPINNRLVFSTILGGKSIDSAYAIALQGDQPYITGDTQSPDFPTTPNALDNTCGSDGACNTSAQGPSTDAFLARISADGTRLVYSTYLGGQDEDRGYAVTVDDQRVYLTGITYSADFPAEGYKRGGDLFVASFDQTYQLSYATLLGGSDVDAGFGIATRQGTVYVTGETSSPDFPAEGYQGGRDLLLASLGQDGALRGITLVGGAGEDRGNAITLDSSGRIQVTGYTSSADLPATIGAYAGLGDALVLLADPQGSLTQLAYIGGTGYDEGLTVQTSSGDVIIGGVTTSADLPTTPDTFQATLGSKLDGFLLQLNPSADVNSRLVYSSFLGGSGDDSIQALALGAENQIYLAGYTQSTDFPVTQDALSANIKSSQDSFLTRLNISESPVPLSTAAPPTRTPTSLPNSSLVTQTPPAQLPEATSPNETVLAPQTSTLTSEMPPIAATSQPGLPSKTATLPERTSSELLNSTPINPTPDISKETSSETVITPTTSIVEKETTSSANGWPWLLGLLLLVATVVTTWLLIRRIRR